MSGVPTINIIAWSGTLKQVHPTPDPSVFPKIDTDPGVYYSWDAVQELEELLRENSATIRKP